MLMKTKEILEKIFKAPSTQYELTEFENLGKPIHEIINIYPKVITSGRESGKTRYFLNEKLCIAEAFVRFAQKNKFEFWNAE
jgi:hypothetical protein